MKKQGKKNRIFAGIAAAVMAVSATAVGMQSYSANAADLELDNYAKLLQYSLYFYDANMCGDKVGGTSAFSWRDNCHTGDVALGGFHDAGDAIKCGQTAGFTASTLGWAYYEYKDQFQKTGTTAHFKVISDEFNEFFKRCTTLSGDTVTSFIYEVGEDGSDHAKWWAPEQMWDHGSSETYSTTDGASDIAAQYAASLAQSYLNFGNEEDLKYAVALYNFATKYRTITYDQNTYAGGAKDVQDDISWAAGWLYLATGEEPYLTENSKYTQVKNDWTQDYCYANSQLGAAIINAEITGNWSFATNYIGQKVNANQNQFYVMNSWGSARYDVLMQFCALVTSKYEQSGVDYTEWAKKQMNYILGDNNANVCLVVGYNDVVEGTVKNVTDFGAFIDLGGADGLLHISEMSWGRVESPKKVFNVGDTVKVFIKDINETKIALSMKFPSENPWNGAAEKFAVGNIVKGKVARMTDFGAFVELAPGVDALLHVSQISRDHVEKPADVLKIGQEIEAKVVDFNEDDKKISLSIKALEAPEEDTVEAAEVHTEE